MNSEHLHHPDVHYPASKWSEDQTLHVAAAISNPFRWETRRKLANNFRRHMKQSPNVKLHMIELAYGDRPYDVTNPDLYPDDIQVRNSEELFHKENLLNLAVHHFPQGWKYGAIIDADFHFVEHDWALEAVHQLQMYDFVQLYSTYSDLSGQALGTGHRVLGQNNSFAFNWHHNGFALPPGFLEGGKTVVRDTDGYEVTVATGKQWKPVGATGGAWAFRRSAFDAVGGLLDRCILGHGDWFMAFGLVGEFAPDMHVEGYSLDYMNYIRAWQSRAAKLTKNIGYVDGHALHGFHGPKIKRGYSRRDLLLCNHKYEPTHDVCPDWQGVLQLSGNKPRFRDDIRRYFLSRNEDLPHTDG
jgi:hypothetical protein